eukprot:scaffold20405_cov129-Isochrysis_galbana.AAC.1
MSRCAGGGAGRPPFRPWARERGGRAGGALRAGGRGAGQPACGRHPQLRPGGSAAQGAPAVAPAVGPAGAGRTAGGGQGGQDAGHGAAAAARPRAAGRHDGARVHVGLE